MIDIVVFIYEKLLYFKLKCMTKQDMGIEIHED